MSNFRTQSTEMNDAKCLEDTLRGLGYKPSVSETEQNVRGHYNETRKATIILKKEDLKTGADVGFSKDSKGNYTVVADTWVLNQNKFKLEDFVKKVTTGYAVTKAKRIALQNGFEFLGMKEVTVNGKVHTKLQFVVPGN